MLSLFTLPFAQNYCHRDSSLSSKLDLERGVFRGDDKNEHLKTLRGTRRLQYEAAFPSCSNAFSFLFFSFCWPSVLPRRRRRRLAVLVVVVVVVVGVVASLSSAPGSWSSVVLRRSSSSSSSPSVPASASWLLVVRSSSVAAARSSRPPRSDP